MNQELKELGIGLKVTQANRVLTESSICDQPRIEKNPFLRTGFEVILTLPP